MAILDSNGLTYFWSKLKNLLNGKANSSHTHAIADVNNLQTTLNGKAASQHSHVINDVTGLQDTLNGKAAAQHTHVIADVNNLQSELNSRIKALTTEVTAKALPSINIGEMKAINNVSTGNSSNDHTIKLPSGGRYLTLNISSRRIYGGIYAGGSVIGVAIDSGDYWTNDYYSGFYIRIA